MVSQEFIKENSGKIVHIDYINNRVESDWVEGTLIGMDYNEDTNEYFIEVETKTDSDRIPEEDIRKIYVKEVKKDQKKSKK